MRKIRKQSRFYSSNVHASFVGFSGHEKTTNRPKIDTKMHFKDFFNSPQKCLSIKHAKFKYPSSVMMINLKMFQKILAWLLADFTIKNRAIEPS